MKLVRLEKLRITEEYVLATLDRSILIDVDNKSYFTNRILCKEDFSKIFLTDTKPKGGISTTLHIRPDDCDKVSFNNDIKRIFDEIDTYMIENLL